MSWHNSNCQLRPIQTHRNMLLHCLDSADCQLRKGHRTGTHLCTSMASVLVPSAHCWIWPLVCSESGQRQSADKDVAPAASNTLKPSLLQDISNSSADKKPAAPVRKKAKSRLGPKMAGCDMGTRNTSAKALAEKASKLADEEPQIELLRASTRSSRRQVARVSP